jgi:hypothetical protein
MAAILCNACGDLCSGACEVCGHVCTAPCRLMGHLCNGVCQVCSGCCHGCETCCQQVSQVLCTSPLSIYVTVATIFNAPPIYLGLQQLLDLECRGSQWLVVNALFGVGHVAAAIYMALKIRPDGANGSSPLARAGHLFCYDPVMAIYILVLAAIWSLNGKASNSCSDDSHVATMAVAMAFGWAFLGVGVAALSIGVCCAYFGSSGNNHSYSNTQYYGSTTTSNKPDMETPYVNAGKVPTVAATPIIQPSKQQEHVPTVKATLF